MAEGLLSTILACCDRGDCSPSRWPDPHGDYWPLNPLRADSHSGSFSVGPKGWHAFASGEVGSLADLAQRLNLTINGCTVAQLRGGLNTTPPPPLHPGGVCRGEAAAG
jgi:hypothetical protein